MDSGQIPELLTSLSLSQISQRRQGNGDVNDRKKEATSSWSVIREPNQGSESKANKPFDLSGENAYMSSLLNPCFLMSYTFSLSLPEGRGDLSWDIRVLIKI